MMYDGCMSPFENLQIAGLQPSLLANKIGIPTKNLILLMSKIRTTATGCWEWMGATAKGYGLIKIRSIRSCALPVHRLCYELVNGPVPGDLDVHHQVENGCMGRICCNPSHLQTTTRKEHLCVLTPNSLVYLSANSTSCQAGHEYTVESTRVLPSGYRQCRICDKIRAQAKRDAERGDLPKFKKRGPLKTHCLRGHDLSVTAKMIDTPWGPQRQCTECNKVRNANSRARCAAKITPVT